MKTADLWYSRHPSAFLIAAIKARPDPPPPPPPPWRHWKILSTSSGTALLRAERWLKGASHRFGWLAQQDPERRFEGTARAASRGFFRDISDSRTKKEIGSPRRKRAGSSYLSSLLASPRPPSSYLSRSLRDRSRSLSLLLSLFLSFCTFLSCCVPTAMITVQIVSVHTVQLGSSYGIFTAFFDSGVRFPIAAVSILRESMAAPCARSASLLEKSSSQGRKRMTISRIAPTRSDDST